MRFEIPIEDSAANRRVRGFSGINTVQTPLGWSDSGRALLVLHEDGSGVPSDGTIYTFDGTKWVGRSVPASLDLPPPVGEARLAGLKIELRESANEPPEVVASYKKRELTLTASDPALQEIWRAKAEKIEWPEGSSVAHGLLMVPRAFTKLKPLPLIIQAYHFLPDLFRPDGHAPSGYAAQALVAQGFAVLQLDIPLIDKQGAFHETLKKDPRQEVAFFVKRSDAAVEYLEKQGIVDANRLGLIGFSRGGYLTCSVMANPGRARFSAAISADSSADLYLAVLSAAGFERDSMVADDFSRPFGGSFWKNKAYWLENEFTFNADRVQTPLMLTHFAHGSGSHHIKLNFGTVGSLLANHRPVEELYFPSAYHQLVRPREREAALTATLDWFNFWIQGREDDGDPEKGDRFSRWRQMKADWQNTQKEEAAKTKNPTTSLND